MNHDQARTTPETEARQRAERAHYTHEAEGGVGGALGYARVAAHTADYQVVDGQP